MRAPPSATHSLDLHTFESSVSLCACVVIVTRMLPRACLPARALLSLTLIPSHVQVRRQGEGREDEGDDGADIDGALR